MGGGENNKKNELTETGRENVDWIHLARIGTSLGAIRT
jgi:hypothetical protein